MGSSRSESRVDYNTTTETNNIDRRIGVTDQGIAFSVDGDVAGSITFNTLDRDVASASIDGATTIATNAIASSGSVTGQALTLGGNLGTRAIDAATTFNSQNTALVGQLGGQLASAQGTYAANIQKMGESYATNLRTNSQDAFNFSKGSLDNILNFGRDTLDKSNDMSTTALAAIRQTSSTLTDFIANREKDPNERAFSNTMPWIIGGGVLIAAIAFGGMRK